MKIQLPHIVDAAKSRPLSFNPVTKKFIYYDEVLNGNERIYPIEKLDQEQRITLAIKRYLTNVPEVTVTLNGASFTNKQIAEEIKKQTKIGKQLFESDINYLEFYLSQFPKDCFEK